MADVKISSLPAATTPVAGTEVLPIVQSSTTVKVSVANLTAGRSVSADSLSLTNALTAANGGTGQSSYTIGDILYASGTTALSKLADVATGNALISGGVGVAPSWGKVGLTTHVSGTLPTANGGTNLTSFTSGGVVYASSTSALATGSNLTFDGTNTVKLGASAGSAQILHNFTNGRLILSGDSGGTAAVTVTGSTFSTANTVYIDATDTIVRGTTGTQLTKVNASTGDLTVSTGNLVIGTSGKGIDFSANSHAAGMTSELLTWYEEGTWTPTVTPSSGSITTLGTVTGSYTRVGRLVFLTMSITITTNGTGAGVITISTLPFSINSAYQGTGGTGRENASTGNQLLVYAVSTTQFNIIVAATSAYPGGNGYRLDCNATYYT